MKSPAVDQYLIAIHENYQASSKKEKSKILDMLKSPQKGRESSWSEGLEKTKYVHS